MSQIVSWNNPSKSYPFLAISKAFGVPYGVVLRSAEGIAGRLSTQQAYLSAFESSQHAKTPGWVTAVARAIEASPYSDTIDKRIYQSRAVR